MSLIPGMETPTWEAGGTDPAPDVNTALERLAFLARGGVISRTEDTEPGSPSNGDAYIMTAGRTGANWTGYAQNDVAAWLEGAWFVIEPAKIEGVPLLVADEGTFVAWDGAAYVDVLAGGGGGAVTSVNGQSGTVTLDAEDVGAAARGYTIVTEASAFTADPAVHAGLDTYTRAGGNVTFDSSEGYTAGEVYPIRATGAMELIESGVTLTPPSGGTLELTAGMGVQVIMVTSTTADVVGQTVPA